jgi:hypothetical protein
MQVDVKINRSKRTLTATCYRAGVWRFLVYSPQTELLPFMQPESSIPAYQCSVEEVIVNRIYYDKVSDMNQLSPGRFCQSGTVCYLIEFDYFPVWMYPAGIRYAIAMGYTTGLSYSRDSVVYRGGLDYYPVVKETADNLEAGKMKFNGGSVTFDNTDGVFDDGYSFFGNTFQVFLRDADGVYPLYEYYMKNIKNTLRTATLELGDKRERLSVKIPSEKYTLEKYPYMQNRQNPEQTELTQKSGSLGSSIPDAYGYCVNLPAVCIDQFRIYQSDPVKDEPLPPLRTYRTFKVCRKITRLDKVMVKMTQPDGGAGSKEVWTDQTAHVSIDFVNGEFALDVKYCMPQFTGYDVPEIYDVSVTGIFGLPEADCTPGKITAELLSVYAGVAFNDKTFNTAVYTSELAPLARIGVYFDREVDIYSAIETIQNASTYSFQFVTDFNRFSAKRNDDGRAVKARIGAADICSPSEIEYDTDTGEYATIIDVGYQKNYLNDTMDRLTVKIDRDVILYLYNVDKTYAVDTLLPDEAGARVKLNRLTGYFSELHPVISGITLYGRQWFDLRCYDIVIADLRRIEEAAGGGATFGNLSSARGGRVVMGIENAEARAFKTTDFARNRQIRDWQGVIRGKIISVEKNTKNETVKISIVKLGEAE